MYLSRSCVSFQILCTRTRWTVPDKYNVGMLCLSSCLDRIWLYFFRPVSSLKQTTYPLVLQHSL